MDLRYPTPRCSSFQSAAMVKAGVVVFPKQVSLPPFSRSRSMKIAAVTSSIARATYPADRTNCVSKLLVTHGRQLCSRFVRDTDLLVATKHCSGIFPKRANGTFVVASLPVAGPESVQIASILFTLGTAFVIPYYTIMILAPHAVWTRKLVESSIPYVILGIFYVYLLALSWTSETVHLMFASKYWLPELPGITKMFSSTITVASAWIHLLALDLFAARQVFLDGQQHAVETRHSLVLCLLVCPIGILSHLVTKAAMQFLRRENDGKTIG